jgi:cyclohexanone monooxygenase
MDAVVVGAGFAGLYALHRLRGLGLRAVVLEAGDGVGGTWFWNRYPGARCDVESLNYSFSFDEDLQRDWVWTERYSTQAEILRYLEHVADRFDLRRDIELNTRVSAATLDEAAGTWTVTTDAGREITARYVVMATGCLSDSRVPGFPGRDTFAGRSFHTASWPDDVDLTGQRVGVIGTGSTAIQLIPQLAARAEHLTVFQRTPAYSIPAHNRPLGAEQDAVKAEYAAFRARALTAALGIASLPGGTGKLSALEVSPETRRAEFQRRWEHGGIALAGAFHDLMSNPDANHEVAEFVRGKIAGTVRDPSVAERLTPRYPFGTKRPCIDIDYWETYNRPNVELVSLLDDPLVEITPDGVRTARAHHRLDALVYATGFDAFTGALSRIRIAGRSGRTLAEHWADGPGAFVGVGLAGFPNLFLVTGPGSPSVLSNMIVSIEQHVDWIADLVEHTEKHGHDLVEPTADAERDWMAHVDQMAGRTLYQGAQSWFTGANVPGKPLRMLAYVGGVPYFRKRCAAIRDGGYQELRFSSAG